MRQIIWSSSAREDLLALRDYVFTNFGAAKASEFLNEVDHQCELLSTQDIGSLDFKLLNKTEARYYYLLINRRCKIYYYFTDDIINIAFVCSTSRDIENLLTLKNHDPNYR